MNCYETVFITRPELTTKQVEKMTDDLSEIIKSGGGKISRKENWGLRNLAFKVRKNKKGHYMMLNYQVGSDVVMEVERKIKLNDDFIRFQTFRTKTLPTKPSLIALKAAEHAQRRAESAAVVPVSDEDNSKKRSSSIKEDEGVVVDKAEKETKATKESKAPAKTPAKTPAKSTAKTTASKETDSKETASGAKETKKAKTKTGDEE